MQIRKYIFCAAIVLSILSSGCIHTGVKSRLVVHNEMKTPVKAVHIIPKGLSPYQFGEISAQDRTPVKEFDSEFPAEVSLQWDDGLGKRYQKTFTQPEPLPKGFKGRVLFQIENDGVARMFVTPMTGNPDSDLPWAVPATWQGAPSIPGLSQ